MAEQPRLKNLSEYEKASNKHKISLDKKVIIISTVVILLIIAAVIALLLFNNNKTSDIIMKINQEEITKEELLPYIDYVKDAYGLTGQQVDPNNRETFEQFKNDAINILITMKVQSQKAKASGIKINKSEFDTVLDGSHLPSIDNSSIKDKVYGDFYLSQKMFDKYLADTVITDDEAKQFYNNKIASYTVPPKVKIAQIYLSTVDSNGQPLTNNKKQEAKTIADSIIQILKSNPNVDFGQIAAKYSGDEKTKNNFGIVGYVSSYDIHSYIFQAANAKNIGETTDIIETPKGYYIVKVLDKKASYVSALSEVLDNVKESAKINKGNNNYNAELSKWINQASVEKFQDIIDRITP